MEKRIFSRLGAAALIVAFCGDQLFWGKTIGISFPIFVLLCLATGFYFTWRNGFRPKIGSFAPLAAIQFFAWIPFVRLELMTVYTSVGLALAGLVLLSLTWRGGRWWRYDIGDYGENLLRLIGGTLTEPPALILKMRKPAGDHPGEAGQAAASRFSRKKTALSILLGLLLALPVTCVLTSILAAADPVFAALVENALRLFELERLVEYLSRFTFILILAYVLCGSILYALFSSQDEKVRGEEAPRLRPFLGWVEASTLLACVDLLLAVFVAVQVRYFFGGRANIHVDGFTYAEYARRGFGELVFAAVLSLMLLWGLILVTRRHPGRPRRVFTILDILLVGMLGVILVSAYQRLLLYEAAYGFTRLRIYTHVFMIWLGILLAALALLEAFGRERSFALTLALVILGFEATLALMNVDRTIAERNLNRVSQGESLDTRTLVNLSEDATPSLFQAFESGRTPAGLRETLGGVLACRRAMAEDRTGQGAWQSFHWSQYQADRLYERYETELAAFPVSKDDWQLVVKIGGIEQGCFEDWGTED